MKEKLQIIFDNIPLACAYACGGATIGSICGSAGMYAGAALAFLFGILTKQK